MLFWAQPLQRIRRDGARNLNKPRGPSWLFCARLLFHPLIRSIFIAFLLFCLPSPLLTFSQLSNLLSFLLLFFSISSPIFCHPPLFPPHLHHPAPILVYLMSSRAGTVDRKWDINFNLPGNICLYKENRGLPSVVCMNDLPQMGNSSDSQDKSSSWTYNHVQPFGGLSCESTAGSMTHSPATTGFFSQQILFILIRNKCMRPYPLCWDLNAFYSLLCLCLCKMLISPRKTHITPLFFSPPLVIIPLGF